MFAGTTFIIIKKMNWQEILAPIKKTTYFIELMKKVDKEYEVSQCFPPNNQIFRALDLTNFDNVKVVILGQDPYHNFNQANGLCFSVSNLVNTPPSLKNIFKELEADLQIIRKNNELEDWAKQGVLLLNSTFTVKAHEPNSHKDFGWDVFTDFIIKEISDKKENVVFILWGAFAQKKSSLIDAKKHCILQAPHPSPFSAYKGFLGSKPFSKINQFLKENSEKEINW